MVILDPQWLTRYVYRVLESEEVIEGDGIFTRDQMVKVWNDLDADTLAERAADPDATEAQARA